MTDEDIQAALRRLRTRQAPELDGSFERCVWEKIEARRPVRGRTTERFFVLPWSRVGLALLIAVLTGVTSSLNPSEARVWPDMKVFSAGSNGFLTLED